MFYDIFHSKIGDMLLVSDGENLTGVYVFGQKNFPQNILSQASKRELEIFEKTKIWLGDYLNKNRPDPKNLQIKPTGTEFQIKIWELLQKIPYGELKSYGEIARQFERVWGKHTSARAVGGAVSKNPLLIVVPCHRVVGANRKLVGFAAGMPIKQFLLNLESK